MVKIAGDIELIPRYHISFLSTSKRFIDCLRNLCMVTVLNLLRTMARQLKYNCHGAVECPHGTFRSLRSSNPSPSNVRWSPAMKGDLFWSLEPRLVVYGNKLVLNLLRLEQITRRLYPDAGRMGGTGSVSLGGIWDESTPHTFLISVISFV